jgi:segregation and condensation protein B
LEIGTEDGYIIQVRVQYLNIVTDMLPIELNAGPLRTLSAIALKEPVLQSEIVDMRGSGAYEHINELVEMDLIHKKPQGLSYILKTTQKFDQYFRLNQEASQIKQKLQVEATRLAKEKAKLKEEEALIEQQPEATPI